MRPAIIRVLFVLGSRWSYIPRNGGSVGKLPEMKIRGGILFKDGLPILAKLNPAIHFPRISGNHRNFRTGQSSGLVMRARFIGIDNDFHKSFTRKQGCVMGVCRILT